jgi:hypothetical protein
MGLPGIFEYHNEKGGIVAYFCQRCIFHLLHTLAPNFRKPRLDCENIPNRRLELVCDDGSSYVLVLVEFKLG